MSEGVFAILSRLTSTSVGTLLTEAGQILTTAGVEDGRNDARILLLSATGMSAITLLSHPEATIHVDDRKLFSEMLARRVNREPVTRILGKRAFWKDDFVVTQAVLDPRPATETLIEAVLKRFEARKHESLRVLDLGTGSGAIICSILAEFPHAVGDALDISTEALEVARRNAEQLGLLGRLNLILRGWAELKQDHWDLIVSNPPYIASGVIPKLDPEVKHFDPSLALDGGPDGLDCYRSLLPLIGSRLRHDGRLFLEIGHDQAFAVSKICHQLGLDVQGLTKDAEGHDRVIEVGTI